MSKRSKAFLANSNVFSDEQFDEDSESKTRKHRIPFSSEFAQHYDDETAVTPNVITTSITVEEERGEDEERPTMIHQEEGGGVEEEGEEGEDALDAYMKQVENRIQIEKQHQQQDIDDTSKPHITHAIREDIEQADELESYMAFLASKGIDVEELSTRTDHLRDEMNSPENSDEEVYATARAIDSR
jgi:hypothetical protein